MSFGSSAVFKWRRQSCPDDEGRLCFLGHGDILVMDGQCQDKFLHCTDPGLEQERINVTFRCIKEHIASCALRTGVCVCVASQRVRRVHLFLLRGMLRLLLFWHYGCSLESCVYGRCGGILCVILGESSVVHKKALGFFGWWE